MNELCLALLLAHCSCRKCRQIIYTVRFANLKVLDVMCYSHI